MSPSGDWPELPSAGRKIHASTAAASHARGMSARKPTISHAYAATSRSPRVAVCTNSSYPAGVKARRNGSEVVWHGGVAEGVQRAAARECVVRGGGGQKSSIACGASGVGQKSSSVCGVRRVRRAAAVRSRRSRAGERRAQRGIERCHGALRALLDQARGVQRGERDAAEVRGGEV